MQRYKTQIEKELKSFFSEKKKESKDFSDEIYEAIKSLEDFTMRGGKRIRALLMIVGYKSAGGKKLQEMIKASIAAELVHSFLLIHDDIIDDDDLRRNGPTIHKSFQKRYGKKGSSDLAMITGDICLCYGLEPIMDSRFMADNKLKAINKLGKIIKHTCYGEFIDVTSVKNNVSVDDIQKIHEYKTAKYTISGPLQVGGMLAGANNKLLQDFEKYGLYLGLAFQLKDDILGIFGDEERVGKPIGSDIVEGKKTMLVLKANSKYVNSLLGKKMTNRQLEKAREIIRNSGSLDYSEKLISDLVIKAKNALHDSKMPRNEKEFLKFLADYVNTRKL
ncbi:polyprenyl synthetase family protein [Candidatus Woesearchaeota archaeon]|nr:polyprenyl synthetase family protein [Candidatus Woesearchaeota archaeon]